MPYFVVLNIVKNMIMEVKLNESEIELVKSYLNAILSFREDFPIDNFITAFKNCPTDTEQIKSLLLKLELDG